MDGRQKPNPQTENDNDMNDADIIDLNQIVEGSDDDDIIDLTNVLEQPDQASDAMDEPDEAVITLMDAIPTQETAGVSEDTDDDIIELLDMTAADTPEKDGVTSPSIDEAEDVIELLDAVEPQAADAEAMIDADDEFTDLENGAVAVDEAEDVIELLDAVEPQAADPEAMVDADDEFTDLENGAVAVSSADSTDADAESSGLDLFDSDAVEETAQADTPVGDPLPAGDAIHAATLASVISPKPTPVAEPVPLTDQQVEDALERVIEKIYSEKIEQLMIQTIEKTVKREIEKIKHALMEDGDGQDG